MAKCKKCVEGVPHEFNHGRTGYTHHDCRCDQCETASRDYHRRRYRENTSRCAPCRRGDRDHFQHGYAGFTNHGCRCEICVMAKRDYTRNYHMRRKQIDPDYMPKRREQQRGRYAKNREEMQNYDRQRRETDAYKERRSAYWSEYATSYSARRSRERQSQIEKLVFGDRVGVPWTPEDDLIAIRNDLKEIEKAAILGRTVGSVRGRRQLLRRRGIIP